MSGTVLVGYKVDGINQRVRINTMERDGTTHSEGKMEDEFGFSMCVWWGWGVCVSDGWDGEEEPSRRVEVGEDESDR